MTRELRKQAFTLAENALERSDEERDQWLRDACSDNQVLLDEVNAILEADRSGIDFTNALAGFEDEPPDQLLGKTLGRFRLVEVLGQGGMGVVFKAERIGDFEQTVAIKIVRQGLESSNARMRFDLERDALARIEHPNIARLIDAGVDDHDRPYFVMEYVDGVPLNTFLEQNELGLRERLTLFMSICDAVIAAHRMLVIHRDLKPSNVLITADLHPKLLDFGISKLVTDDQRSDITRDGAQLFTPEYASPEQIVGGNITTAVDIYGLGALLYFMLSGERPFGTQTGQLFEYLKSTVEDEPMPPSAAIREHARSEFKSWSASRMVRAVSGDVDNITMRALNKRPEDRYGSVADLTEDVQRFLDGKAILAKPPSFAYQLSKFVRRHWAETSLAALLLVSLIGGLLGFAWQARQTAAQRDVAQLESARANQINEFLTSMLQAADPRRGDRDVTVVEVLEKAAIEIENTLLDQPVVASDLLFTIASTYESLGKYELAEDSARRSLALRRDHYAGPHSEVALGLSQLGTILQLTGKYEEGEAVLRQAFDITQIVEMAPTEVASIASDLGVMLAKNGKEAEAETYTRQALELYRTSGASGEGFGSSLNNLAVLLGGQGRHLEAEALHLEAVDVLKTEHGDVHPRVAEALFNLAGILDNRGRYVQAEPIYHEVLRMNVELLGNDHPQVIFTKTALALNLISQEKMAEARILLQPLMDNITDLLPEQSPLLPYTLVVFGQALYRDGELDEGEQNLRRALALRQEIYGPDNWLTVNTMNLLGDCLVEQGKLTEAESLLIANVAKMEELRGSEHENTQLAYRFIAKLYRKKGDVLQAEVWENRLIQH